jgi:acyl carrier protein
MSTPNADGQIYERLSTIFRKVFEDETIVARPEMTASEVQRWDSLSHVDMIVMVEQEFSIRVPTREVIRLKNVGDLVRIIKAREP